jgi:hypothetical protein
MGRFEDRLWSDLVQQHGSELALAPRPAPRRRRTPPALLTGGAAGVLGTATVLALTLDATTSTPAFAVTNNSDGTVTVTIHDIAGVGAANAELARLGVRATAVPAVSGCTAPVTREPEYRFAGALRPNAASYAVTIKPGAIPRGDTLVLAARQLSTDRVELGAMLVRGSAPACSGEAVGSLHPEP